MKAKIVLILVHVFLLSAGGLFSNHLFAGGPVVTKAACTEYQAAWLYSDGVARSFIWNNSTGHVELQAFQIGGRKAVDISTGFNQITILDDQGYVWLNDGGKNTATRFNTDATGAAGNGFTSIYGYFYTYGAIRSDGSIWYWGGDDYKFYGGTAIAAPKKIPQPAGVRFIKLAMGNVILGLTATGDVYQWSKGSSAYIKINLPKPATDIAASHQDFFVAVVPDAFTAGAPGYPYCWGAESRFWGGDGSSISPSAPVSVKSLWKMPYPIKKITANHNVIHYIDTNGDLYGIGDNPNGEIGNGQELVNHAEKYPTPYAWSWIKYELLTGAPAVHVAPGTKFKDIFTGNTFAFYHYALDVNDSLYFWGRNKSFVGGDGAVNNNESTYPNAMDVLVPTRRTPMGVAPTQTIGYNFAKYTLKGIPKQTVITSLATLSAVATPSLLTSPGRGNYGYSIVKTQWTKVSGPGTPAITAPNSLITTVTGLTTGTYVFSVQTTDNNTGTITAYDTVVVNSISNPSTPATPTLSVSAGPDASITLPTSSYTIAGVATVKNETISLIKWTQVSGPNTATIGNGGTITPTVSGLVAGTYVFSVGVNGASGLSSVDQMTLVVNAAPSLTVDAGANASITLPVSSYTIAGVATVKNETITSIKWTQSSGPNTAAIANGGTITPTVSGLVAGTYVFKVTATGQSGLSATDQMSLVVNPAVSNITFVASAGPDASITLPTSSYTIAGVATVKNTSVTSCRWTQVTGPNASKITGGGSVRPTVSGLVSGTYTFQITIVGTTGLTSSDVMTLNVKAAGSSVVDDSTVVAGRSNAISADSNVVTHLRSYPNPVAANQSITLEGQTDETGRISFQIFDAGGRQVKQVVVENLSAYFRQSISVQGLVSGVYFLRVQATAGKRKPTTFTFIVQ